MKVYVNNKLFHLTEGMTVKHALIAANLLQTVGADVKVFDVWGNEVGLDGAVSEGERLYVGDVSSTPPCRTPHPR